MLREKDPNLPAARFEIDITSDPEIALQYAERDVIDVFLIDLRLRASDHPTEDAESGKQLVSDIQQRTNAGIIVHSSLPYESQSGSVISLGADDYIEKMPPEIDFREGRTLGRVIRTKIVALWRRVQLMRPTSAPKFQHTDRQYRVGAWLFRIGTRTLVGEGGEQEKLSPTEHALLRYLCLIEDHEIDREQFNVNILGRDHSIDDRRLDNIVYRLRTKLGTTVQLLSSHKRGYKLIGVREVNTSA